MTQGTKKLFDCRCAELAVHFLFDGWMESSVAPASQEAVDDLALHIQQAVEDWFAMQLRTDGENEHGE